jgi:hypothetical protein
MGDYTYKKRPWWYILISPTEWGEAQVNEIANCLRNTHSAQDRLNKQLEIEFGIYYNAATDDYRKLKNGARDDAVAAQRERENG